MTSSVAVTGLGLVSGFGAGTGGLGEALRSSAPRLSEVGAEGGYRVPGGATRAALVGDARLEALVSPAAARRMSASSRWAVAAARMALSDAGLGAEALPAGTGVYFATAFGAVRFSEELVRRILLEGPESASPFLFPETVANAPAAQIAIACGARGPSVTVTQREAGPLLALGMAARDIARGRVRLAIAGAVEEAGPLVHAVLDRFRALARPDGAGREEARPFDLARRGFVMGEGAAALVLETGESALERRRRVRARVIARGAAFDPTAPAWSWGAGYGTLAGAIGTGLERAGVGIGGIDRIVSGASGSVAGDRLEARTLRAIWGERRLPPILAPKGVTGEYGGAFLAAAVLAAEGEPFGPTPGFRTLDPECGVVPHDGAPLPPPALSLVTSLAAGGAASWVLLGSPRA